jgi:SPP1 gp7 family putative phage head morphogenesis protein
LLQLSRDCQALVSRQLEPILADYAAALEPVRQDALSDDPARTARVRAIKLRARKAFAEIRATAVHDFPHKIRKVATRFATRTEQTNRVAMNAQFHSLTKLNVFGTSPEIDNVLHEAIRSNALQISSIPETQINQVERVVYEAMDRGSRVETLRNQIEERFSVSESKAELIARTETAKFNATLARTRQEDLGISRYKWSNSHDERVRGNPDGAYPKSSEDHWHLEDQICSYDDPPVVDEKRGIKANPGERPNCRCTAIPLVDDVLDALGVSADEEP